MGFLQKLYLCLALTAVFTLNANGQRNRYSNNNNNNNRNGGYNSGFGQQCNDKESPCEEGKTLSIQCPADYNNDDVVSCIWKHEIPTSSSSSSGGSQHITCGANGCSGPDDHIYTDGRSVGYYQKPCTLEITQAHPDDSHVGNTGEWECHLQTDSGQSGGFKTVVGSVDLFISNKSEIYITDPGDGDSVQYDLDRSSRPIEATCTAYGGSPTPIFHWYVDEDNDRNEIQEGDGDATFDLDDYDDREGRRAESTISFSPSLQTLCDLNLDEACDMVNGDSDFNGLNFNLICKVEQASVGDYSDYNNRMDATVMVEVSSANPLAFMTSCHLIALLGLGLRLLSQ